MASSSQQAPVVARSVYHTFCISRYESNGSLDGQFGNGGKVSTLIGTSASDPKPIALVSDGRFVVAGECQGQTNVEFCMARFTVDGLLDSTFGAAGSVTASVLVGSRHYNARVEVQSDGKLVIGGNCGFGIGSSACLVRTHGDGAIDLSFGQNGRVTSTFLIDDTRLNSMVLLPDGTILVGGLCGSGIIYSFCLNRLKAGDYPPPFCGLSIDLDESAGSATGALLVTRYLLGYRGDALVAGVLGQSSTLVGQALLNYLGSLKLDADGDGKALAMTDGLLMLRAMLGLTGDALTRRATNSSHPNVRNAQQILAWIADTHGAACLP